MGSKRHYVPTKNRVRNLTQYRELSEEDFEIAYKLLSEAAEDNEEIAELFKQRTSEKLELIKADYDLDDMKANDMMQLNSLLAAMVTLEDTEYLIHQESQEISAGVILYVEKLNSIASKLRKDISDISSDLDLVRKIRRKDKQRNVLDTLEELKGKAKRFYKERMLYLFCTECKMLLATVWLNYPDSKNTIKLKCEHCGHVNTIKDLTKTYETDNKNVRDVVVP